MEEHQKLQFTRYTTDDPRLLRSSRLWALNSCHQARRRNHNQLWIVVKWHPVHSFWFRDSWERAWFCNCIWRWNGLHGRLPIFSCSRLESQPGLNCCIHKLRNSKTAFKENHHNIPLGTFTRTFATYALFGIFASGDDVVRDRIRQKFMEWVSSRKKGDENSIASWCFALLFKESWCFLNSFVQVLLTGLYWPVTASIYESMTWCGQCAFYLAILKAGLLLVGLSYLRPRHHQ